MHLHNMTAMLKDVQLNDDGTFKSLCSIIVNVVINLVYLTLP